jgi:hypothetical protein
MIETETPTPTATPTPTLTLTPTVTPTPTPNIYWEGTAEPDGLPVRVAREMSPGEYSSVLLQWAILISIWIFFIVWRFGRGK